LCTPVDGNPPPFDLTADADPRTRVIELESGREVLDLSVDPVAPPTEPVQRGSFGGAFNPAGAFEAGRYLAANVDGRVEFYDMASGEYMTTIPGNGVLNVEFDPQGRWLAVAAVSGRAVVVDLAAVVAGPTVRTPSSSARPSTTARPGWASPPAASWRRPATATGW
jgi:hypothetical protein